METIASRTAYENPWLTLREDQVRWADGSTGIYSVVVKPDFALVVPRGEGGCWMVEQYRYPIGQRVWEFPQGGWTQGHEGSAEELARAELAEETGLRAGRLEHLGRLCAAYGFSAQRYDVWLATELTEGEPAREATEADMVHRFVSDAELDAMLRGGELVDAHSVAALTLLDRCRPGRRP